MLKILGDVFIIASLLPWVNFGLNSQDTQVWPIIFGLAFLFSISKKIKVPPYFIIISFCFTLGFIFAVMNTSDYSSFVVIRAFAGYFGFLILLLGLYNYLAYSRYDTLVLPAFLGSLPLHVVRSVPL